jgi:hypothetical protein
MVLDILFKSSALQRAGAQARMDFWIASRPVVHWHFVSASEQPEPWTAVAKQGSYEDTLAERPYEERNRRTYSAAGNLAQVLSGNERKGRSEGNDGRCGETHVG